MDFLKLSKITIYSFLVIIFAITGITCFILSFPSWSEYGIEYLKYDHLKNNYIPLDIQLWRATAYFSLIFCLFLFILSFLNILKIEDEKIKKILFPTLGIFTWVMLPYLISKNIKNKYFKEYINFLNINNPDEKIVSIFDRKSYQNKKSIFYITFMILTMLISLVGIVLIISPFFEVTDLRFDPENPRSTFLFGSLSFFTQQSNMIITIFIVFFLFFSKKNIFRNNDILLSLTSYIFIVFFIFWTALFPKTIEGIKLTYPNSLDMIRTVWLHGVNPLFFVIFSIWTLLVNKEKASPFTRIMKKYTLYPFVYAIYAYGLPFFTQFSVYGIITNINPLSVIYYDSKYNNYPKDSIIFDHGNPLIIFAVLGLVLLFIFVLFLFWCIAMKISGNSIKSNLLNKK